MGKTSIYIVVGNLGSKLELYKLRKSRGGILT